MQATGISRRRKTLTAVMACMTMVLGTMRPAAAAPPEALQQAPQDADVVLIVPDLAELNAKLANLRQALNLPMPEMDDALGAFKRSTGMTAGVNDDGAMIVVMPDLAEALQAQRKPQALLIVPVSDYAAFVGNFGGNADEEVTALTMPGADQSFGRKVDGYAVIGETREAVEAYEAGNAGDVIAANVGQLGRQYLGTSDALVYLNMQKLAPALMPLIDQGVTQMTQQFQQMAEMGMMAPDAANQLKTVYSLYGSAAKTVARDSTGMMLGLDISDAGVGFTKALAYKPGSELAKLFPGGEANPTKLTNLPEQPFIVAMAMDAKAVALAPLYKQVIEAMPKGDNAFMPAPEVWLPLVENLNGFAAALYAPDDMALMSGNVMNTLSVVEVDNPEQYIASFKNYVTKMNGFEVPVAGPMMPPAAGADGQAGEPMKMTYNTTYNDNALQLDGVQVDQFQLTTVLPPELTQQMGPAAGFMKMFTNYGGYIAAKDGKVVVTTVIDPQMVTKGFQAIGQGGGIGAAGALSEVRDAGLPPDPVAEAYISFSGIAQAANVAMSMFGMPPIQAPAELPPVAMGLSGQENSLAFRLYVPVDTARFAIDTAMGMMGTMMGGPRGPQGPGPGQGGPPPF